MSEKKDDSDSSCVWDASRLVADQVQWDSRAVSNVLEMLDQEHTIPFIARYRKERTHNMEADKLREVKQVYDELRAVDAKVQNVIKAITKMGKMTPELKMALRSTETLPDVEHLYAPYKSASARSLAERAKELGLESFAQDILKNPRNVDLNRALNSKVKGLDSLAEVETGVKHIIADIIAKNKATMDRVRQLCKQARVNLMSTKSKTAAQMEKGPKPPKGVGKVTKKGKAPPSQKPVDLKKFELYFNFQSSINHIKPHQVMAINRGESLKVLSVKVDIDTRVHGGFMQHVRSMFMHRAANGYLQKLVEDSAEDAHKRLIEPLMIRHIRSDLNKSAEHASVEVFVSNLRRLLLTPPVRGRCVLGVDPGFTNGCKYAVTSSMGAVLASGVAYLHSHNCSKFKETKKIVDVMVQTRCHTVAIGNGTACRETEAFFADHIKKGTFNPLSISYCIVSESGASIYSASDAAKKEMPELDITIRGAVSIARRLQDPLAELVKIDPKHIGVGMYQHDVGETQLRTALDGVVEDCVSFVGVNLNTCSQAVLRKIAGLNEPLSKKIIDMREGSGPFVCREQLKTIKGLGPKTFLQCAGFVRILPQTETDDSLDVASSLDTAPPAGNSRKRKATSATAVKSKKAKTVTFQRDPLDMTSIHPESYHIAESFLKECGLDKTSIGMPTFINDVKAYLHRVGVKSVAQQLAAGEPTVQLIVDGLQQQITDDFRDEFEKPLFKQGMTSMDSLRSGDRLTGRVTNMTHFGAFVDIGVGNDGLLHSSKIHPSKLGRKGVLELGDRIEVIVNSVEVARKRIGLELCQLL